MNMSTGYIVLPLMVLVFVSACERPSPDVVRERQHLPPQGFVADTVVGKQLFDTHCATCHGPAGRGTEQGPPLVHRVYRPGHHSDMAFHYAVKNGTRQHHWHFGDMPPVSGVSPEDTAHIVAYIREEQRRARIINE